MKYFEKANPTYWILRLFFVLFLLHAHTNSFASESSTSSNYYIVPLEFVDDAPYITVTIEDKKVKLVLDTGATTAIFLPKRFTNSLKGMKYTGKYDRSIDAGGKIQNLPLFDLDNAQVSDYHISNVIGTEYEPWGVYISNDGKTEDATNLNSKKTKEGVIGLKFFQNNNLIIDYSKNQLIILKPGAMHPDYSTRNWHSAPLSMSKNVLTLQALLDGNPHKFLIDTGSTASILKRNLCSEKKMKNKIHIILDNFFISGKNFGPIKFWMLDFSDPDFDGFLGYDFFSQNVIYLDFYNKTIKIS